MTTINSNYHLPKNAYWSCSDKYNGISQIAKLNTSSKMNEARQSRLTNLKISDKYAKQLA